MKPILKWQYEQLGKELLLIQGHGSDPDCPCASEGEACMRKHLMTVEALAQETLPIETDNKRKDELWKLSQEAKALREDEERVLCGKKPKLKTDVSDWSRDWRKQFEEWSLVCSLADNTAQDDPLFDIPEAVLEIPSPFGWPGGKKHLAARIVQVIPAHKTYVEPFAGAASVFWRKKPSEAEVLNDMDADLMRFYRTLRDVNACNTKKISRDWKALKSRDGKLTACEFLAEVLCSFGCMRRTKADTEKCLNNAPQFHRYLPEYKERLATVKLHNEDWAAVVKRYDAPDTFFFLDPPYHGTSRGYNHADDQLSRLADILPGLKGKFLLTYDDHPEVRQTLSKFEQVAVKAYYTLQAGDNAAQGKQLMIANFPLKAALRDSEELFVKLSDFWPQIVAGVGLGLGIHAANVIWSTGKKGLPAPVSASDTVKDVDHCQEARDAIVKYEADIKAGHTEAAQYWKGQAEVHSVECVRNMLQEVGDMGDVKRFHALVYTYQALPERVEIYKEEATANSVGVEFAKEPHPDWSVHGPFPVIYNPALGDSVLEKKLDWRDFNEALRIYELAKKQKAEGKEFDEAIENGPGIHSASPYDQAVYMVGLYSLRKPTDTTFGFKYGELVKVYSDLAKAIEVDLYGRTEAESEYRDPGALAQSDLTGKEYDYYRRKVHEMRSKAFEGELTTLVKKLRELWTFWDLPPGAITPEHYVVSLQWQIAPERLTAKRLQKALEEDLSTKVPFETAQKMIIRFTPDLADSEELFKTPPLAIGQILNIRSETIQGESYKWDNPTGFRLWLPEDIYCVHRFIGGYRVALAVCRPDTGFISAKHIYAVNRKHLLTQIEHGNITQIGDMKDVDIQPVSLEAETPAYIDVYTASIIKHYNESESMHKGSIRSVKAGDAITILGCPLSAKWDGKKCSQNQVVVETIVKKSKKRMDEVKKLAGKGVLVNYRGRPGVTPSDSGPDNDLINEIDKAMKKAEVIE